MRTLAESVRWYHGPPMPVSPVLRIFFIEETHATQKRTYFITITATVGNTFVYMPKMVVEHSVAIWPLIDKNLQILHEIVEIFDILIRILIEWVAKSKT
jgi:hypothetical protein